MKKLEQSIVINAPKEKIWDVLLSDATYRQWTEAFAPGSHAVGDWTEGSEVQFLSPECDGMFSKVAVHQPFERISFEHLGVIKGGEKQESGAEAQDWAGATETYILKPEGNGYRFEVVQDIAEAYYDDFVKMWQQALQNLKELSEKS